MLSGSSNGHLVLAMVLFYLHACLPACLSVCLPICISACLSVYLPVCLSACLSACLPACLSVCLSVYLSICTCLCLPIYAYLLMPTVCTSCLCYCLCLPVCNLGERSARSKAPPDLIDRLIILIRIVLYGRSLAVYSNGGRLGCLPRRP